MKRFCKFGHGKFIHDLIQPAGNKKINLRYCVESKVTAINVYKHIYTGIQLKPAT